MQVNITIPDDWKPLIDKIARKEAYERDKDYSYLDVIRDAIKSHCKIIDTNKIEEYSRNSIGYIENLKIYHPIQGLINFKLYDFQKRYIKFIEDNRFVIVPKFRQGGFSTATLAWALWDCIHNPNRRIMIGAKSDREAIASGEVVRRMLEQLPIEIKPTTTKNNEHTIEFENKSILWFYTLEAARGKSLTHLILDEAAFIPKIETHWKAMYPTISTGGRCTVVSTQNGPKTWFNTILEDARNARNDFKEFKCSYLEHPIYNDTKWAKETKKVLGKKGWLQEVECRAIESECVHVFKFGELKCSKCKKETLPFDNLPFG